MEKIKFKKGQTKFLKRQCFSKIQEGTRMEKELMDLYKIVQLEEIKKYKHKERDRQYILRMPKQ